jgi:hypothetical protein
MWPAGTKLTKYTRTYGHGMDAFKPASISAIMCVNLLHLNSRRLCQSVWVTTLVTHSRGSKRP